MATIEEQRLKIAFGFSANNDGNGQDNFADDMTRFCTVRSAGRTAAPHNKIRISLTLKARPNWNNKMGIVHGGCIATIIDNLSTQALMVDPRYWEGAKSDEEAYFRAIKELGVSRNLSIQYIQAIPSEAEFVVETILESNTKRNIYLTCRLYDAETGKLYCTATHDKVKLIHKL
jgi:acyl-coenzyme A thioesterase PaaI-like protein